MVEIALKLNLNYTRGGFETFYTLKEEILAGIKFGGFGGLVEFLG